MNEKERIAGDQKPEETPAVSTLDQSIFPDELLKRIEAMESASALIREALPQVEDVAKGIRQVLAENAEIKEKFRVLQNRCNNVLALAQTLEAMFKATAKKKKKG
jgi:hypothetical protein